jgi:hypothetical protein
MGKGRGSVYSAFHGNVLSSGDGNGPNTRLWETIRT